MKWSFKIGSIMGIPVKIHLTFLLLLLLVYFAGASVIGSGGLNGVIFVVLVFASVVFHELSHALVARHYGINVVDITLLPIGGVARMANPPERPVEEIFIAIAGPAASLVLAFGLWFVLDLFGNDMTVSDFSVKGSLLAQLTAVNIVLAVFNLLPAFPMDGGRVLRGLLALKLGQYRATHIAVGVGQVLAIGLFFLGLLTMNPFVMLIALFVYLGAETEERQVGIMMSLGGATARSAMSTDIEVLRPTATVADAAELSCRGFQADFPILDGPRLVGLLTREMIVEALHRQGPTVPVQDVMVRDFPVAGEQSSLVEVLGKIQETGYKAVPILRGAELKGIITLEQIGRYNMLCSGYVCNFPQTGEGLTNANAR
jgi:Zn-dependent protease/CBS domain-containing protein